MQVTRSRHLFFYLVITSGIDSNYQQIIKSYDLTVLSDFWLLK